MDGAVRETCCSSCSHRDVCAHKDDYLSMIKSLEEMFYKFPENERVFMHLRDPDCKFYSKELAMPRALLTQSIGIPENMAVSGDRIKSCAKMIAEDFYRKRMDEKTDI